MMVADSKDPVCGQCGSTITGDAGFCGSCGTPLTAEPIGRKPESPGWYPMADGSARFWDGTMWTTRSEVLNLNQGPPTTASQEHAPPPEGAELVAAAQEPSISQAIQAGHRSSRRQLWWAVGVVLAVLVVGLAAFGLGSASRPGAAETVAQSAAPVVPPPTPAPSPSVTAVTTPTAEQATALLDGMYAALSARDPAGRDTFIVADVKPKVTTDVLDDVGATAVTVSEVTLTQDSPAGPGSATFAATITLTQPDGDSQVERHWFTLITTPDGIRLADTDRTEVVTAMPPEPTPSATTLCVIQDGPGEAVSCSDPICQGDLMPGHPMCAPLPPGTKLCTSDVTYGLVPCPASYQGVPADRPRIPSAAV